MVQFCSFARQHARRRGVPRTRVRLRDTENKHNAQSHEAKKSWLSTTQCGKESAMKSSVKYLSIVMAILASASAPTHLSGADSTQKKKPVLLYSRYFNAP